MFRLADEFREAQIGDVGMSLDHFEQRLSIELSDVVLADCNGGVVLEDRVDAALEKQELLKGAETLLHAGHVTNYPHDGVTRAVQRRRYTVVPEGHGLFHGLAGSRRGFKQAATPGLGELVLAVRLESRDVSLENAPAGDQKAGWAKSYPPAEEGFCDAEGTNYGAEEGGKVGTRLDYHIG